MEADKLEDEEPGNHSSVTTLAEYESKMANLLSLASGLTLSDSCSSILPGAKPVEDVYSVSSNYVSVIKFNGQPIPPPVLTRSCRLEMLAYKEAAIKKEQEIVERRRLQLLDTVQGIVNSIEVRKKTSRENTPCNMHQDSLTNSSNQCDTTLPCLGETEQWQSKNSSNQCDTTLPCLGKTEQWQSKKAIQTVEENYLKTNKDCATDPLQKMEIRNEKIDTSVERVCPSDITQQPEVSCSDKYGKDDVPQIISSSASSMEKSALNRTAIAADNSAETSDTETSGTYTETPRTYTDTSRTYTDTSRAYTDTSRTYTDTSGTDIETSRTDTEMSRVDIETSLTNTETSSTDMETSRTGTGQGVNSPFQRTATEFKNHQEQSMHFSNQELLGNADLQMSDKLQESWSETESNRSFLGEYRTLPLHIPVVNTKDHVTRIPDQREYKSDEEAAVDNQISITANKDCFTLSDSYSTQPTMDTVAQSCTLPLSLFSRSSSDSTLCEVPSPFEVAEKEYEPISRASVEQKSNNNKSGNEPQFGIGYNEVDINTSEADATPAPPKRVRRNSYTLEHPSPALLDAKARNEAPYASNERSPLLVSGDEPPSARRSLNLESNNAVVQLISSEHTTDQAKKAHDLDHATDKLPDTSVLTEENLLRLQLDQFERIKRQLEQEQKDQLQEMLLRQQQEQIALETEMAALELRVNQQNSCKVYSSVFGVEQEENHSPITLLSSTGDCMLIGKHDSEATIPSHRDSLENILPPSTIMTNSHTSPALHTHRLQLNLADTIASNGNVSEVASSLNARPFYLQHTLDASVASLDYMSREGSRLSAWMPASDVKDQKEYSTSMRVKFERVSAAVKGYLTRRLMRTHKVQSIIKTIRDTVYFVDDFQAETPIKQGKLTVQDIALAARLLSQLRTARDELYDTFQTLTARERMEIIAQARALEQQQLFRSQQWTLADYPSTQTNGSTRPLSAATLKVLERKNKTKKEETNTNVAKQPGKTIASKSNKRPKSSNDNSRVLKPIQGNQSPPSPVGAPFRFTAVAGDVQKPRPVIHRHTTNNSNKNTKNKAKSQTNSVTTSAAAEKKNVRRSLYPATKGLATGPTKGPTNGPAKGPTKGPAKGSTKRPAKGIKTSTMNKK